MKNKFKGKVGRWLVVLGLLLMMGITSVGFVQAASLSYNEEYWLTYMREEEKLARDVYLTLYDTWKVRIFKNIASSEQTHMDAIKTLLDRYGIPDPAKGKGIGEFTTEEFDTLYAQLVAQGRASLVEALTVGVTIEDKDIDDLKLALVDAEHRDIRTVYTNLLSASYNHLSAFKSQLAKY